MVKPGFSQDVGGDLDHARVARAAEVALRMAEGEEVAPEAVAESKEALVAALWVEGSAAPTTALLALVPLAGVLRNPEDKAELVGEMVAAGQVARPVFDGSLTDRQRLGAEGFIGSEEWQALADSLADPLKDRMALVAGMLGRARGLGAPSDRRQGDEPFPGRGEESLDVPRPASLVTEGEDRPRDMPDPSRGGLGPAEGFGLGSAGLDATVALPEDGRLDDVVSRGAGAVTEMVGLLSSGPQDQEFAATALIQLGQEPVAQRQIYHEMRRLEGDPELRPVAEHVRAGIERGSTPGAADPFARGRARNAGIQDGWLRRALATCDSPSIMRASAGREAIALPLALRQLARMRCGHGESDRAGEGGPT